MRHALRWCTLLALVRAQEPPCGLATDGACVRPRTDAPSFVVAVADDMGHGDAGYLGGHFPTPELDKLARDAIRLQAFYAASPVCSPTRATALTGRNHFRDCVDFVYGCSDMTEVGWGTYRRRGGDLRRSTKQ